MPLPEANNPIQRPSIREEVYTKLLTWIMEGTLSSGEKIVDKDLASHMGVSRTPVREALRRLEDKGLVESAANRWTRISRIPPEEPEMVYPIVQTLEKLALSAAASSLTAMDFKKMSQANARLKTALKNLDSLEAAAADDQFHAIFIQRSGNTHLIDILEGLKIKCRRLEVHFFRELVPNGLSLAQSSIQEHTALVEALKAQNLSRAEQILHLNWEKSRERFRMAVQESAMETDNKGNSDD